MGNIRKVLGKAELPSPDLGWNIEKESFCLPFSVELKEDIHLHWQDIRIEMTVDDFNEFAQAINRAHKMWVGDGKPESLDETKWYGAWPGEEEYDFYEDRHYRENRLGHLCHHYRLFPRTEMDKLYYDSVMQIEIQHYNWFHIHYKNFRWEIGPKAFLSVAKQFTKAAKRYRFMILKDKLKKKYQASRSLLGKTYIGKIKRWAFNRK